MEIKLYKDKMTETQSYIIDVINLVPVNSILFVQAPSIENSGILNLMQPSSFEYYKQILLSQLNKRLLIEIISNENIEVYFQSIEIRFNEQLLFEAYDGMEFGTMSKKLRLTDQFTESYIYSKKMCIVSSEW
jgi:hypothetical protein